MKAALNRIFAIEEYGEDSKDTWANPGNSYDIDARRVFANFCAFNRRYKRKISPENFSRISPDARLYIVSPESREPRNVLSRALFDPRPTRNYPTKFKTGVRTLLGGIVETAGRLLPRGRAKGR